jgi:hypothetical protein
VFDFIFLNFVKEMNCVLLFGDDNEGREQRRIEK